MAFYKKCNKCNNTSVSSTDRGIWICPYCNKDITSIPSYEKFDDVKIFSLEKYKKIKLSKGEMLK